LGKVFILINILLSSELISIVTSTCLGLLVNILLVIGVIKNKRWYLIHWMIYHGLAMFGLFTISILVFVIQTHLLKLIGLAPLAVVVMLAIIWIQVYQLFEEMLPLKLEYENEQLPTVFPQTFPITPPLFMIEGPDPDPMVAGTVTSDYEFYPVDPLSRGIFKKFNQNALQNTPHPPHLSFLPIRREDGDYDVSLRTGKFFRFYDVRGLNNSAENLYRDHIEIERDEERKFEEHMDFKSSGSSLNI